MNKRTKKPIIFFVIVLAALYTVIYIVPKVSGALVSSYIAQYGQLKICDETTAYFVRNEKVYLAHASGQPNYFFEEGSLVRKDAKILEMAVKEMEDSSGGKEEEIGPSETYTPILNRLGEDAVVVEDYRSEEVGVVSYFSDGYEFRLTPDTIEKGKESFYQQLSQEDVIPLQRESVVKGEPLFKIVDRTEWYMVCFVDKEHADRYEAGSTIKVEFEDGEIDAQVYQTEIMGEKAKVVLHTNYYYDRFAEMRIADVSLVTYDEKGVIIENSSITEEKGQAGVYVKNKGDDFFFVPIKVYATDGKKSLIADDFYYDTENDGEMVITVEVYDEILKHGE